MRECQWGLTLRYPTADESIADVTPQHVKPLQFPVLKFCITNVVLLLPPSSLIIHVYQYCLHFEGWLSSHIKTLMNLISPAARSIKRVFPFSFPRQRKSTFTRVDESALLHRVDHARSWLRHIIFKSTVSSSSRFSKRWQIFLTGQINWLWYLAHLLLKPIVCVWGFMCYVLIWGGLIHLWHGSQSF